MHCQGGAGSSGGQGRWSMVAVASSLGPAPTAGTLVPPQKITMGQLRGTRSPPGLNTHKQYLKRPRSLSGQIRPRPAGLSIRQRPAGETITGWLDK